MSNVADARWSKLLAGLHDSEFQIALVAAGGGSGAFRQCFARSGASRTFLEAVIPYARASMAEYLEVSAVESCASLPTVRLLATAAFQRAQRFLATAGVGACPVGVSLTAALPTEPPRPDEHRIFVALQRPDDRREWSVRLPPNGVSRAHAETISDELLFAALASLVEGCGNRQFFEGQGLSVTTARTPT